VILLWLAIALMIVDLFATHRVLNALLTLIGDAYAGQAPGPVQFLFTRAAQDAWKTPVQAYLEKARLFYTWSRYAVLLGGVVLAGWFTARVLGSLPEIRRWRVDRPWPALFLAAVLLGLCSAIRVFGPFAGRLITISFLVRLGKRAWLPLGVYWMVAAIVLYAAWPYLWGDPVGHLMDALQRMSRFPWMGRVLYDGLLYSVTEIPWHYVPRSMLFQLTLPAILIGGLGLWVALASLRDPPRRADVVLLLVWLSLPLLAVVAFGARIYDAFRRMMFILPPLFLLAAIGFRYLFNLLPGTAWRGLLVAIAVLPGLVAIARLHPYEYIYYNELAGGVRGAFRRYELDGWCISHREAIEHLNGIAPPLSRVVVPMESHTVEPFARGIWSSTQSGQMPPGWAARQDSRSSVRVETPT